MGDKNAGTYWIGQLLNSSCQTDQTSNQARSQVKLYCHVLKVKLFPEVVDGIKAICEVHDGESYMTVQFIESAVCNFQKEQESTDCAEFADLRNAVLVFVRYEVKPYIDKDLDKCSLLLRIDDFIMDAYNVTQYERRAPLICAFRHPQIIKDFERMWRDKFLPDESNLLEVSTTADIIQLNNQVDVNEYDDDWQPQTVREALAAGLTVLELPASELESLEDMIFNPADYDIPEDMLEKINIIKASQSMTAQLESESSSSNEVISFITEPSAATVNEPHEGLESPDPPTRPKHQQGTVEHPSKLLKCTGDEAGQLGTEERSTAIEKSSEIIQNHPEKNHVEMVETFMESTNSVYSQDIGDLCDMLSLGDPEETSNQTCQSFPTVSSSNKEISSPNVERRGVGEQPENVGTFMENVNSGYYSQDIGDLCDVLTPFHSEETFDQDGQEIPDVTAHPSSKISTPDDSPMPEQLPGITDELPMVGEPEPASSAQAHSRQMCLPRVEAVATPRLEVNLDSGRRHQAAGKVSRNLLDTKHEKHSVKVNYETPSCSRENSGSCGRASGQRRAANKAARFLSVTGNKELIPGTDPKRRSSPFEGNNGTHASNKRPTESASGASDGPWKAPSSTTRMMKRHRRLSPATCSRKSASCPRAIQPAIALHSPVVLGSIPTPVHSLTSHQPPKPDSSSDVKASQKRTEEQLRHDLSQVKLPQHEMEWAFNYLKNMKGGSLS